MQNLTRPAERRATLAPPAAALSPQSDLAGQPAVKLSVKHEGWYRITQPDLIAAGLDPTADPRLLQLYVDGRPLPMLVQGEQDGRFDVADAVEFYGVGVDAPSTDTRVYWLVAGSEAGQRIARLADQGGLVSGGSFPYTVERRDRSVYFAALRNGEKENFFGALIAREPVEQTLLVQHLDQSSSREAVLEVALQGVTEAPHRISVQLNGAQVGEVLFEGQREGTARLTISPSQIKEGQNQITLRTQGDEKDISLVDYIRLTYPHSFTADHDALRFTAPARQRVTIDGFTRPDIRVMDVTNPDAVREIETDVQPKGASYAVTLTAPEDGERTLFAFAAGQAQHPASLAANEPSQWRQAGAGADLVILSHRDFLSDIEPLRALRQSQGWKVAVVNVEDIYDEFSFGQKTPRAVKDFLAFAKGNWEPAPRFALLVGDASLDPKNYLGLGNSDFVPTKLFDAQLGETASDDWLADFDGDGLVEMAVGRLPVRTAQEAALMVAKIIGYEPSEAGEGILLVADRNRGYDFATANDQLRSLIPAAVKIEEIRRGQVDDATTKSQLLESLNRGPWIVNYTGHGSVDLWAGSLLTSADARALSNGGRLSVVVTMTCLNGYFHDPALDGLAEALMKAERGGAVAVWASSGLTGPGEQTVMNQALYRLLFSGAGDHLTLGEATARAKIAISDGDIRRTWILFGDPTMPFGHIGLNK